MVNRLTIIKSVIKDKFPTLTVFLRNTWKMLRKKGSQRNIFSQIYDDKFWVLRELISGPGSDLSETVEIRQAIPEIVRGSKVITILDAPCGDFNWMKIVSLDIDNYIEIDFY